MFTFIDTLNSSFWVTRVFAFVHQTFIPYAQHHSHHPYKQITQAWRASRAFLTLLFFLSDNFQVKLAGEGGREFVSTDEFRSSPAPFPPTLQVRQIRPIGHIDAQAVSDVASLEIWGLRSWALFVF